MRLQATLLAALATLVSVPAVAQPAVPPGPAPGARPATAPDSSGSPDAADNSEQREATEHKKHDATPSDEQATNKSRPSANGQATPEAATNNNDDADNTPDAGTAPEPIPPALDTLEGHVSLAASTGLAVPFGELQQNSPQSHLMGSGAGFGVELGYGVSRSVVIGAWGQALRLGGGSTCTACSTSSFAFGPFVRYHLVQGVRFDPWISAGIGFRTTTLGGAPGGALSYSGLEWLRLRVGGDWYAFSKLGFGPFVELDAGHYQSRPAQTSGSAAAHLAFSAGLRVIVDLPGK